jgi:methylated-DNA-[protein]-cysteine S-methyltransferase
MINKYYAYYSSPIGILEITSSEDAILSVVFVDEATRESENNPILNKAIGQFEEYFNGKRKEFDLKINLEGTEFQKLVWKELLKIPHGEVISYRELAGRIGNEKASRAVGNANGKNTLSIIVPCHRVIGSNKRLTGYEWGLDRKQWLLEHERSF